MDKENARKSEKRRIYFEISLHLSIYKYILESNKYEGQEMNSIKQQMKMIDKFMGDVMGDLEKLTIKTPNGYLTTLNINGYEVQAVINYEFIPACRGARGDYGMQMEPDEPAHIEFSSCQIKDGNGWYFVDLPEIVYTDILAEILEHELG